MLHRKTTLDPKAQHVIREAKKTKESRIPWMKELKAGRPA